MPIVVVGRGTTMTQSATVSGGPASPISGGRGHSGGTCLNRGSALVVERLRGLDHALDAEPLVDQVVAGAGEHVGERMVGEQPHDGVGQRRRDRAAAPADR